MGRLLWSSDQSAASVPHGRGDLAAGPQLMLFFFVSRGASEIEVNMYW